MLAYRRKFKKFTKPKQRKADVIRSNCNWNKYQLAVFDNVANGDGHTIVEAGPGSGKTTTLVEALFHIPQKYLADRRTLATAYNTSIANVLDQKAPAGAVVKTTHGLGFATCRYYWGSVYDIKGPANVDKDNKALYNAVHEMLGKHSSLRRCNAFVEAVDMAKTVLADDYDSIVDVIDNYNIDLAGLSTDDFADIVMKLMLLTREAPLTLNGRSVISFTDMIWLPHANGWMPPEKYDRIILDEAQDQSPARTELVLNALAYGGRLLGAGDKFQAINAFAGSDPDALPNLIRDLKAKVLPLSVSYRLPLSVIALAQEINPNIEAAPNAIEGLVSTIEAEDIYGELNPGDVFLSRLNYPLIKACFGLVSRGKRANIQGREIANRLIYRVNCWQPSTIEDLRKSIVDWHGDVTLRLLDAGRNTTLLDDEAKSLLEFTRHASNISEAHKNILNFFSDEIDNSLIKLSSVHRAKGLEWDNVYMLNNTFHPERGGEEENIHYVALTRAKQNLTFVDGKLPG